jgi:sec-independent protein translocase protein TatB
MFDWNEIVLIGVVALIVIGPKELPAVLRTIGQWTTKLRRMAGEFQSQFQEAMREAEMADLKKQVDEVSQAAKVVSSDFDPLELREATNLEPRPEAGPLDPHRTMPESSAAAVQSETQEVATTEATEASVSESSSGQGGVGPVSVPATEASGRA